MFTNDQLSDLQANIAADLVKLEQMNIDSKVLQRITETYQEIYNNLHEIRGLNDGCSRTDQ